MQITLDIPEELINQLGSIEQHANLTTAAEILALRPSAQLQLEIDRLSEKHQSQDLTDQERQLWQQYEYLEHIISMAKAKAYLKLNVQNAA
jgi:DNA-binding SARP family transcriptional activator